MTAEEKPRAKRVNYHNGELYGYRINCKGCGHAHVIPVGDAVDNPKRDRWTFNGDVMRPTFTPSLLCHGQPDRGIPRCHSFITDGRIQYLSDCTHAFVNQTIDLPPASPMLFDGEECSEEEEKDNP